MGGVGIGIGLGLRPPRKGASAYAPYPAPNGFAWDFVTYQGARVTYRSAPVVTLIRIS